MKIYVILRNFSYIEGVKINFSKFLEIKNKNYKNFEKYHKNFEKYEKYEIFGTFLKFNL